ncbi:MAG: putative RNA-binding protein containing domain, ribosomal protein [Chthoniobacteraceae bacterium]|nr:putative RNA-binding protein containing domain, ribosomal protein [Chthoniobacteraceae bacterium]MDB6171782.1 putative RNA-binding protein containing domain, ribosomal protein [Chthoniobacteraceae bacterium]
MPTPLTHTQKNELKARAQRLEPVIKLGQGGITPAFLQSLNEALDRHGLVKVKFVAFKEEKKLLVPQMVEQTQSYLIMRVGNVAVFYREPLDKAAE